MILSQNSKKQSPQDVLIGILSQKPNITVKKAYEFFLKKYESGLSIQGFYKIVRQLLRDRVIVKNDTQLSLDMSWVANLMKFTATVKATYLDHPADEKTIILSEGEVSKFSFGDVIEMDNFWDHALRLVIRYYETEKHEHKDIFSKNYYSWIQVIRTQSSIELSNSYGEFGLQWFMSSGSKTLLNTLIAHLMEAENFHFKQYEKLEGYGEGQDNFHVTVIGDFIFETKLPPHLFGMVKKMFEETKGIANLNTSDIEAEMLKPSKTLLTITRDKKKAGEIRKNIEKSFK